MKFKKFLAIHALCYFVAVGEPCLAGTFFKMKLIPISQTRKVKHHELKLFAQVDDEDYDYLMQWKWSLKKGGKNLYAYTSIYTGSENKRTSLFMHRLLLKLTNRKEKGDHIDHNGLNNQKDNLRKCSHQNNMKNVSSHSDSVSIYAGVCFHKKANKWMAQIRASLNNHVYLGLFKNEVDAAKAYDKAAKKYHGEFANLNFK